MTLTIHTKQLDPIQVTQLTPSLANLFMETIRSAMTQSRSQPITLKTASTHYLIDTDIISYVSLTEKN